MTISKYAALPVKDAYLTLGKEFRLEKEFMEKNAAQKKLSPESLRPDNKKPSGRAYLVLAVIVVTLLAPLKIGACLLSLLLGCVKFFV
jgi:hypothetical protein